SGLRDWRWPRRGLSRQLRGLPLAQTAGRCRSRCVGYSRQLGSHIVGCPRLRGTEVHIQKAREPDQTPAIGGALQAGRRKSRATGEWYCRVRARAAVVCQRGGNSTLDGSVGPAPRRTRAPDERVGGAVTRFGTGKRLGCLRVSSLPSTSA